MSIDTTAPRVFLCYAHTDNESQDPREHWLKRLRTHLEPYEARGEICVFCDDAIELGSNWHAAIQENLRSASVVVLLVSASFLASTYITTNELPVLLQRERDDGLSVIPIILSPCAFDKLVYKYPDPRRGPDELLLSSFQAAGSPKQSLYDMSYPLQERTLTEVAQSVRDQAQLSYATRRTNHQLRALLQRLQGPWVAHATCNGAPHQIRAFFPAHKSPLPCSMLLTYSFAGEQCEVSELFKASISSDTLILTSSDFYVLRGCSHDQYKQNHFRLIHSSADTLTGSVSDGVYDGPITFSRVFPS